MINPRISPITLKGIKYDVEFRAGDVDFLLMSEVQDMTIDANNLFLEGSRRLSVGSDFNYDDSAMSYFLEERAHEYILENEGKAVIQVWN